MVGQLTYRAYGFINDFLEAKKKEVVAYDPSDVSKVWLIRDKYYEFTLIDAFFNGKSLKEVEAIKQKHEANKRLYLGETYKSEVQLGKEIDEIIKKRSGKDEID